MAVLPPSLMVFFHQHRQHHDYHNYHAIIISSKSILHFHHSSPFRSSFGSSVKTFDIGRIDFYHEPFAGLKIDKVEAWRLDMKIISLKKRIKISYGDDYLLPGLQKCLCSARASVRDLLLSCDERKVDEMNRLVKISNHENLS